MAKSNPTPAAPLPPAAAGPPAQTLDELKRALEDAQQQHAALTRVLEQRKQREKERLLDDILALAAGRGFAPEELLDPLIKRLGPKKPRTLRYVDPGNPENVYVCGPTPQWLKENMLRDGYDPEALAERIRYRQEHLLIQR